MGDLYPTNIAPHEHYDRTQTDNSTINEGTDNFPISKVQCTQEQLSHSIDNSLVRKDHSLCDQYRQLIVISTIIKVFQSIKDTITE